MNIEYYHASRYGNGTKVAEEFKKVMSAKGVNVNLHHIRDIKPKDISPADLYLFSSPGRFGRPIGEMQRFLKKVQLPPGTKYAVMATEFSPQQDNKKQISAEDETDTYQRVIPVMDELLQNKGLLKVAENKILVSGLKGPLEENWQRKVEAFASAIAKH